MIKAAQLLFAVVVNGPKYVTRFWLELEPISSHVLFAIYLLLFLAAIVGIVLRLWNERDPRLLIGSVFALLVTQAVFLRVPRSARRCRRG